MMATHLMMVVCRGGFETLLYNGQGMKDIQVTSNE
jgi:hypothetical protein